MLPRAGALYFKSPFFCKFPSHSSIAKYRAVHDAKCEWFFFHDVTHAMDKVNFENSAFYNPDNENDSRPFNKIREFFFIRTPTNINIIVL